MVGVQALQLSDDRPTSSSRTGEGPDHEGRKRRRITPTSFVPAPAITHQSGPSNVMSLPSPAHPVTWDHLVKWETGDDNIVGDIEKEGYYTDVSDGISGAVEVTVSDGEDEDDMPIVSTVPIPSRLGSDRVAEIINNCIETYVKAWKPGKGEFENKDETGQAELPVVYDALQLWEAAENAGERDDLADKYEEEAKYYRQRLDVLCEEIYRDPGHTEAGIRKVSDHTVCVARY